MTAPSLRQFPTPKRSNSQSRLGIVKLGVGSLLALALVAALSAQGQPDRSKPPSLGPVPQLKLPAIQKRALSNGVPVWLVEAHEVPLVQVTLLLKSGSSDDPAGKYGLASLTAAMLDEGAGSRSALEIADEIDFLGADLGNEQFLRCLRGETRRAGCSFEPGLERHGRRRVETNLPGRRT